MAEYACFVQTGHQKPEISSSLPITWQEQLRHLDHPVASVTWDDVIAYAGWLTEMTGEPWHLPSEAEWEKAARWDIPQRHARIYPWGDGFEQSPPDPSSESYTRTTPVGTFPAGTSPCGAQDMIGNVWEWTSTIYQPYPYNALDGRERGDSHRTRVMRGCSWSGDSMEMRAAYRIKNEKRALSATFGFRLASGPAGS